MEDLSEPLDEATEQYLRSQPGLKYPLDLVTRFPRIANQIVRLKDDPAALRDYFHALINDLRGDRKGFPFEVLMDIDELRGALLGETAPLASDQDRVKWVS